MQTAHDEAATRLASIIESAMDAIITVDENQRIVLYNHAAATLFGVPEEAALGSTLDRFIPPHYRASHGAHIRQFGKTGVTTRRMGGRTVYGMRADGSEFPIDASISQISVNDRKLYTVILRDVSDRVQSEAALARALADLATLSRAANQALEDERRRIARELHDELGQMLTAMKIDIADMRGRLPPGAMELNERCEQLRALVDETIAATRRMSADLRPLVLDDLGLAAAVDWLAQNFSRRTGLRVSVHFDPALAHVDEPHASTMFRVIQESLTNIMRHAAAQQVEIEVTRDDALVRVAVRDDGRGIRPEDMRKPGSLGLVGVRERVRLLGGTASVEARAEGGTQLIARFPYLPSAGIAARS